MSHKFLKLDDELYEYLLSITLKENDLLTRLRQETAAHPLAEMQIAPEQGQFMALLLKLIGAKKILEIGVFTGYSSLVAALALPDEGKLIALDVSPEFTAIAKRYWQQAGVDHKIDLRIAPALESLDYLIAQGESGSFDFAFIDADKANYYNYYQKCLELVRTGGLILIDNILWSGQVIDQNIQDTRTRAIRLFNEKLHQDNRVFLSSIAISDGLTIALKL
ncbi:MAG: class I SAM-dependent methyltransferase [Cyanobacteriota bacterium ELA615]